MTTATYNAFTHTVHLTERVWGEAKTAATAIWSSVFAFAHREPEADPIGALPVVTPETWEAIRHNHSCGTCSTCSWYRRIWATVSDGFDGQASPTAEPADYRWRSAEQALQTYGTAEGRLVPKSGSTLGRLQDAAEYGRELERKRGRKLSSEQWRDLVRAASVRGPSVRDHTGRSDDFVEVDKALRRILCTSQLREGMSYEDAVQVLLYRCVGVWKREKTSGLGRPWTKPHRVPVAEVAEHFEVSPEAVRRMTRRVMHALRVELGARGLTAMPRMGTRAHHEAHKRREELGNG